MSNLQDFLEMKKYYLDVIKEKDQRIAELEQDLEFTTKTANELIEIKHKLEQELAELKEKAIAPKFKIGQECYLIDNNFNYFKNTKEFNIVRSNIKKQQNWYYVKDYGVYHENDLFATEQEAQAKLQELRGGE